MSQPSKRRPLRDLPLAIEVNGVPVAGVIRHVYDNDIEVELLTGEVRGLHTGAHIPHFAMGGGAFAIVADGVTTAITPKGQQRAEDLLRELHRCAEGGEIGWAISQTVTCSSCDGPLEVSVCGSEQEPRVRPRFPCPYCGQENRAALAGQIRDVRPRRKP